MLKIGVCAGHGLGTPGKQSPDGTKEWTYNNKVVKGFIAEMNTYQDVKVIRYDDPSGKRDVPLEERTDRANKDKVDYYISFHENAFNTKATGTETFTQEGVTNKATLDFAKVIHEATVKAMGLPNRGLKKDNFHITRETNMPACLVEGAFMDNKTDLKKLKDDKVLANAGKQAAVALAKFKKLKKKATPKPVEAIKPKPAAKPKEKLARVTVEGKQVGAFGSDYNVVQAVEKALKDGKKNIKIEEV